LQHNSTVGTNCHCGFDSKIIYNQDKKKSVLDEEMFGGTDLPKDTINFNLKNS